MIDEKPSYKNLIFLSLPSIFSSVLEPLAGIVDTALVGQLNTQWLAALGLATTALTSFTWAFNFLVHASTHSVSNAFGQKNPSLLSKRVFISLIVSLGVGVLSTLVLFGLRLPLYQLVGVGDELFSFVEDYFGVRVFGHTLVVLFSTGLAILRGLGKVYLCMTAVILTTLLNIVLSYTFLYKLNWGISGVAWGTVIANGLGALITLFYVVKEVPFKKEDFHSLRFDKKEWFYFGKNSFDLFGRSALLSGSFFIAIRLASELGVFFLASHQVVIQVWLFIAFFTDGLAITANIKGSNYLSQEDGDSFRLMAKRLYWISGWLGLTITMLGVLFSNFTQELFTKDPQVLKVLKEIWPLIMIAQPINCLAYALDGLIFGLGGFHFLRKHMFIGVVFLFLPMALLWKSIWGIWVGILLLNIYRGVSGIWFTNTKSLRLNHG